MHKYWFDLLNKLSVRLRDVQSGGVTRMCLEKPILIFVLKSRIFNLRESLMSLKLHVCEARERKSSDPNEAEFWGAQSKLWSIFW